MMTGAPAVPGGWSVAGSIPQVDLGRLDEAKLDELVEDLLVVRTPGGTIAIDVGWYPEADPAGAFRCVLVEDDAWQAPIAEIRTRDSSEARRWVDRTVAEVATWIAARPRAREVDPRRGHQPPRALKAA